MQKVTIIKGENGYILKYHDSEGTRYFVTASGLIDDTDAEVESMGEALTLINELIGPMTSRYSAKRIHVNIVEGDKYDIKDE